MSSRQNKVSVSTRCRKVSEFSDQKMPYFTKLDQDSEELKDLTYTDRRYSESAMELGLDPSVVGLTVDYLTRIVFGSNNVQTLLAGLSGSLRLAPYDSLIEQNQNKIKQLATLAPENWHDRESINIVYDIAQFDQVQRGRDYEVADPVSLDDTKCSRIITMVNNARDFLQFYSKQPVGGVEIPAESLAQSTILGGEIDYITDNVLWDLKVIRNIPSKYHKLQVITYWALCQHSEDDSLKKINTVGIYNPWHRRAWIYNTEELYDGFIHWVEQEVIGYPSDKTIR